jgi:hypothetical protein
MCSEGNFSIVPCDKQSLIEGVAVREGLRAEEKAID